MPPDTGNRDRAGLAVLARAAEENIHRPASMARFVLDRTSYKKYYVNYEMGPKRSLVDILWESKRALFRPIFPLVGWWPSGLGVGVLDFVLNHLLELMRFDADQSPPIHKQRRRAGDI